MFTGIIEDIGKIAGIKKSGGKWEFKVSSKILGGGIREGDSVAIDGVCLTATKIENDMFYVDASLETLKLTTLYDKKVGDRVNLERAMGTGGRFGGHFVMGHVDGIGSVVNIKKEGDSLRIDVEIPTEASLYVVKKGSIAIDGISLTVNEQHANIITVNVIPYTASKTTIKEKGLRDKVNIEADIIGKYVQSFVNIDQRKGLDKNFLYEHGFIKGD
ncbi:MAG TPA: riboflavin synthase [Syntrophorhabdaceae bacterium]|jgi:riboflavin synthase|nr:riboflavin synthase [Syntrophorhabdaceae bacterium]MDI9562234.1 riboflavin synthase [Pseudomonadota bacterium]OQC49555.1 MAG: Riboflavin synthase [Deltaproteobacteria bacterium ADurb.Bin026]MBV6504707.1 Riboflavin synthase [Syntrophorhabdaceae bacterium]HNQ64049.1 riboflavin synthase [Syntrophorhabdaceae bacterium]